MNIVQMAKATAIDEEARIAVSPRGRGREIAAIPSSHMHRAHTEATTLKAMEYLEICAPNAGPDVMGSVTQRIRSSVIRAGTFRRFRSFG